MILAEERSFPPFSLTRLLRTCFGQGSGERVCVLIDLPNPADVKNFAFLEDESLSIQNYGHAVFYQGFKNGALEEMGWKGGDLFAYRETGGSNLDMDDEAYTPEGQKISLDRDIYPNYDIILTVSTFSATAPLTAKAKEFGFRGATLHGLNQIILDTGLSVDYNQVSSDAEKLRLGLTQADRFEIDFEVEGQKTTLTLYTNGQEAQKSHGLCPPGKPDVANLPAGEVYFVPESADGQFPFKYSDETLGLLTVEGGFIKKSRLIYGDYNLIKAHNEKLVSDPMTGAIGELGFGTQVLPFSGRDIQDEKILGTCHIATGRSDHLGGHLTPDLFKEKLNASHDDVLYAPHKTPEIRVPEARMYRGDQVEVILRNYKPGDYLINLIEQDEPAMAAI
jgi:aminopeptidase